MKKTLTVLLALVLVIAMSVAGTMAYLTSTDTVTNTFTVGNVQIKLDEAPVDANGAATNDARVKANNYKLIPGHTYSKDPIVHVAAGSEDCWLFVKVTNEIAAIEADTNKVATQMANNDWTVVDATNNVYAYKNIVSANANVPVFTTFTVAGTVDNTTLATYDGKTIVVTAYAVQADGFDTAAAAWTAASGSFTA